MKPMINNVLTGLILLFFTLPQINASTVSLSERQGPSGSVIQIPVNFTDVGAIAGAEFLIQYDPALLEFINASLSTFTEGFVLTTQNKQNKIAVTMANATGLGQTRGILLHLSFRIRLSAQTGTATELTILSHKLYDINGNVLDAESKHGVIKVSEIVVYPDPFTPNDDGFNDYATFVVPDSISGTVTVKLYSITGSKVAEISGINNSTLKWDGRNESGQMLRPGPYIYIVQSQSKTLSKGTITIMH